MEISIIHRRKLIRFFSNPSSLSSLHRRPTLSLSSPKQPQKPSISVAPPNDVSHCPQLPTKPITRSLFSLISSTVRSVIICRHDDRYPICCYAFSRPHSLCKTITTAVSDKNFQFENFDSVGSVEARLRNRTIADGVNSDGTPNQVSDIIELVRRNEDDLELKLNLLGANLYVERVTEIFRVLSSERVSGLRFFGWIQETKKKLYHSSTVCSMVVDNCGWLDDFGSMISLLKEFKTKRICLTEQAFEFLPIVGSSEASIMNSIRRVTEVLDEAGGSCRGSGICALIKMLCTRDSFEMAKFVMEITEKKVAYYNILVLEMCRKCRLEEAWSMLDEMRQYGCEPNVKTYNYLLSSLCKNATMAEACGVLNEMQEKGCPPDALSFEILICFLCRLGKLDVAIRFFDHMVSRGIEPRCATHATIIRSYFNSNQYEEAHNYVVSLSVKYKHSGNLIYSLLASLHQKGGDINLARDILIEMMDKGFRPIFSVYMRILKRLNKPGSRHLARDLKSSFSRLRLESSTVLS